MGTYRLRIVERERDEARAGLESWKNVAEQQAEALRERDAEVERLCCLVSTASDRMAGELKDEVERLSKERDDAVRQRDLARAMVDSDAEGRLMGPFHAAQAELQRLRKHLDNLAEQCGESSAQDVRDLLAEKEALAKDLRRMNNSLVRDARVLSKQRDAAQAKLASYKRFMGDGADGETIAECVRLRGVERELEAARIMINQMRADLDAAAKDFSVPVPAPGTDMARILTANVLLRRDYDRLRNALNVDQTGLAKALDDVRKIVGGWSWLGDPEQWGSYEYDERTIETLRKEAGWLLDRVHEACATALKESGDIAIRVLKHGDSLPLDPGEHARGRESVMWGLDGETWFWWLVLCKDGEPFMALHPTARARIALRDSFVRWSSIDKRVSWHDDDTAGVLESR